MLTREREALGRALRTTWGRVAAGILVAVALVVGVTAALGGFQAVEAVGLPERPVGEPQDLGEVQATVYDYTVRDDVLADRLPEGASAWLVVRAEVEVLADTTPLVVPDVLAATPGSGVLPGDGPELYADRAVSLNDGSEVSQLQPGVPVDLVYLWPVADPAAPPEPLVVELIGTSWFYSPSSDEYLWGRETPVATVDVPRNDAMPGRLEALS